MLSIIIPTLNEEKILEKTLRSLRKLTNSKYEIIVSDGHSTDATVAIAKKYADQVVEHDGKHRQTIGEGRNAGAAVATGKYLLFIDADVFIPNINEFFIQAIHSFESNKKLVGLTVFLKVLPEEVTLSDKLFFSLANRVNQFSNNVLHLGTASGEFMMVRAETFRQIGGFDPKLVVAEDNDLFGRLSKLGHTRVETGLHVMHTSRRAHSIGWIALLGLWLGNFVYNKVKKKSLSKEWKVIR
jgi:glycosyltransferase involved in cell wall biosynthesis